MNEKLSKYVFILVLSLSITVLVILSLLVYEINSKIPFSLILIASVFLIIQTFKIIYNNIHYKRWDNYEMTPTLVISVLLLSIPQLLYFIVFQGIYIVLMPLLIIIAYIMIAGLNLIKYMNGFYISKSRISLSSIINILERKEVKYTVQSKVRKYNFMFPNKVKVIFLPYFDCRLLEKGDKIIIKPSNRKTKKSVYNLIDLIEKEYV